MQKIDYNKKMNQIIEQLCSKPTILLHSCCAPCSCSVIHYLAQKGESFSVLFYNPNIVPVSEYRRRADENKRICQEYNVPFIELEYDNQRWCELTEGLENLPERSKRCDICFEMRLKKAFEYAKANGFNRVSSVLGFSRYKDFEQVNRAALRAGGKNLYEPINWRKGGLQELSNRLNKDLSLYNQKYCGCKPRKD